MVQSAALKWVDLVHNCRNPPTHHDQPKLIDSGSKEVAKIGLLTT
jgi:hypothetical protein